MPLPSAIRSRRSAAQLRAVAAVEREIRAADAHSRRKYLRDFYSAFRSYQSVLNPAQLASALRAADVLLVADYHALAASQRQAAALIEQLAAAGRSVVFGLETIFARDQHILDEWLRGDIDEQELRERIRYDLDWGYDWQPVRDLLAVARARAAAVYGLDCVPRDDPRRIGARDRHAAAKIAELRARHPRAALVVLFGESHLAPGHLPRSLRELLPRERVLTVLQNVDALYWRAAGERRERVDAVRVSDDVLCVFNSSPLEKYESYRLYIERWRCERAAAPDLAPTLYNLIDALLEFLRIEKYSARNGTQPRFLVDLLPQVYGDPGGERLARALSRRGADEGARRELLAALEEQGACYAPAANAMFVRELRMAAAAEQAARFVHHACRGNLPPPPAPAVAAAGEDVFYTRALEAALGYFGSRVLCPSRPAVREADLYPLYAQSREQVESRSGHTYREYMRLLDFIVMHCDYEANLRQYLQPPPLIAEGVAVNGEARRFATRHLGYMLGSRLYEAWVRGRIPRRFLRSLFFRDLAAPGSARAVYFEAVRRARPPRPRG